MSTMSFEADGKRLTRIGADREATYGSDDPVFLKFSMMQPWQGVNVAVSFWQEGRPEDAYLLPPDGVIKVPDIVASKGFFRVSLARRDGDGFYKTNKAAVRVRTAI